MAPEHKFDGAGTRDVLQAIARVRNRTGMHNGHITQRGMSTAPRRGVVRGFKPMEVENLSSLANLAANHEQPTASTFWQCHKLEGDLIGGNPFLSALQEYNFWLTLRI